MTNGVKQPPGENRQSKLIFETLPAVDGDEIDFLLRINPRRSGMRQTVALRAFHARMLQYGCRLPQGPGGDVRQNSSWVGTPRCGVRTAQRAVPTKANEEFCPAPGGPALRRAQDRFLQMVGASRCDARTAQRAVPTTEMKAFVSHPFFTLLTIGRCAGDEVLLK